MPPQRGRKLARAARRREERHKKAARSRRPPFCPPTGHFDGGDYAGVQLHREDEVRVNNYEAFMLEKARQVVTSVAIAGGGGRRELPRNRHVNASGTGIHGCQMRTRAVAAAGAAAGDDEVERAWPHVEEGDDDAYGADAEVFDWTEAELTGFVRRLGGIDLLSTLSEADLRMLAEHLQPRDFAAGEAIVTVGDPADGIYLIESGSAQAESESGVALGAPLTEGYFGELALESDRARSCAPALCSPSARHSLPLTPFAMGFSSTAPSLGVHRFHLQPLHLCPCLDWIRCRQGNCARARLAHVPAEAASRDLPAAPRQRRPACAAGCAEARVRPAAEPVSGRAGLSDDAVGCDARRVWGGGCGDRAARDWSAGEREEPSGGAHTSPGPGYCWRARGHVTAAARGKH